MSLNSEFWIYVILPKIKHSDETPALPERAELKTVTPSTTWSNTNRSADAGYK